MKQGLLNKIFILQVWGHTKEREEKGLTMIALAAWPGAGSFDQVAHSHHRDPPASAILSDGLKSALPYVALPNSSCYPMSHSPLWPFILHCISGGFLWLLFHYILPSAKSNPPFGVFQKETIEILIWDRWLTPLILALRRLRQKQDYLKFEVSLGYIVSSRIAWATE